MKIRAMLLALATTMSLALATTASAVEFSVLSATTITVAVNEQFTIDVALDNVAAANVTGVVGTIVGMQAAGAVVTSGTTAVAHFVQFCSATACFGGINSNPNMFFNDQDLSMSGAYTPGDDSAVVVSALALSATAQTGAIDPGLDGPPNTPSARDVTISLQASTPGMHVLTFGGNFSTQGMGSQPITSTATVTVNVPEPGAIAASLASLGTVFAVVGIRRRA